jgi:hypothetical protein
VSGVLAGALDERHGRDHAVGAPHEPAQQRYGVLGTRRLPQHLRVDHHDRVGTEHEPRGLGSGRPGHGSGLGQRQPPREERRRLVGLAALRDVRGTHLEGHGRALEQVAAARRGAGEDQRCGTRDGHGQRGTEAGARRQARAAFLGGIG